VGIKTVILAGGLGTRLREETEHKPKPLVEIGGLPILYHIMKYYSRFGYREFIICGGYKVEKIKDFIVNLRIYSNNFKYDTSTDKVTFLNSDLSSDNWNITVLNTGKDTPTGGRILQASSLIEEDYFLCTYGDGLSDININHTVKVFKETKSLVTLSAVKNVNRFGVTEIDDFNFVTSFEEKPKNVNYINGGFFVISKEIDKFLNLQSNFETDVLPLLSKERKLTAYRHNGNWQSMDTYREFLFLNNLFESKKAFWL